MVKSTYQQLTRELVDLRRITDGCRDDMHEPDEAGVSAKVTGKTFDNAGFATELRVTFKTENGHSHTINLATLVALARLAGPGLSKEAANA